ncbi:peptidase inhibitor family I36 protein [Streptomyces erythrochromogenes]|uniref:peptidase inhibitor family I36 protein n=1 Tax=Streptomyces erythrochromogenes TaxID=285574 RepID=UPI00342E057A
MNKRAFGSLAAAAAIAGVLAAAPTASAAPVPPGCDKGYFCIYSGDYGTGQLVLKSDGNWSGSVTGRSIFNNGAPFPGFDHIQVEWKGIGSGSECVHFYPGPGDYGINFNHNAVITKVTWRGEC